MKALQAELKQLGKNKKERKKAGDPLHNKWMKFGGGFYGVVAMLTLIVVEWSDIKQFGLNGFQEVMDNIGIGLLIDLLVQSFTNFIVAISWPVYWMDEIESAQIWLWFLAAYAGYTGGAHLARYQAQVRKEETLD